MTVLTIARSLAHMFVQDGGAQSIATIPLDAFSSDASAVIVGNLAQWGLTQLMFGLLYALALWRYQSLLDQQGCSFSEKPSVIEGNQMVAGVSTAQRSLPRPEGEECQMTRRIRHK